MIIGPYANDLQEFWPVLPFGQFTALHEINQRRVAVIWHDEEFPRLGRKPWFALTGGILPTTLHSIWLYGLMRLDKGSGVYHLASSQLPVERGLSVGRARLTPLGRRVLEANR